MNLDLLYTIGVGNSKSNKYIITTQFMIYLFAVDMSNPFKGILVSLIMTTLISTIFVLVLNYYNSESALSNDDTRYIKSINGKNKVFGRLLIESYFVSISAIAMFYFLDIIVAKYSLYTTPLCFIIVLVVLINHEKEINNKFDSLRECKWVFDYKNIPIIKTTEGGKMLSVQMFNLQDQCIVSKDLTPINMKELFSIIPPGTKIFNGELTKPNYKVLDFNPLFTYVSMSSPLTVLLDINSLQAEKIKDLYIDVLSTYSYFYDIEIGSLEALYTNIIVNNHEIETYIEKNDYISKFVYSKAIKIPQVSIRLKEEFINLPINRFVKKVGKKVENYDLEKTDDGLYLKESIDSIEVESNISYLEKYMSLNIDEYYPMESPIYDLSELEDGDQNEDFILPEAAKNLYRINIKGELVYVFIEDIKALSELDEIIVTKFINRDIFKMLEKANIDKN